MSEVSEDRYYSDIGRFSFWPSGETDSSDEEGPMTQDNEIRIEYRVPWDDAGESILPLLERLKRPEPVPDYRYVLSSRNMMRVGSTPSSTLNTRINDKGDESDWFSDL